MANTVVAVAPGAGVVARYRKLHLYDAFGQRESEWVAPGDIGDPEVFEAGGIRFGLQTCYDARFPEVTRRIVDAGADVVCMPAEWVRGPLKEAHWRDSRRRAPSRTRCTSRRPTTPRPWARATA